MREDFIFDESSPYQPVFCLHQNKHLMQQDVEISRLRPMSSFLFFFFFFYVLLTGSYTLVPIQFGFRISINFSSPQAFSLTLEDESGTSETRAVENRFETFDVTNLKPCTNYSHKLSLASDNRLCEYLGSSQRETTWPMSEC